MSAVDAIATHFDSLHLRSLGVSLVPVQHEIFKKLEIFYWPFARSGYHFDMSFFRKKSLQRFFKYSVIGGSTFLIDLALLVIFTDFLGIYYIFSAGLAFLIAVSLNYFLSRHFVFIASKRSIKVGYLFFMIITSVGLGFVMSLMYIFVDVMQFNYILSRVGIAAVVGVWNYLMNLYFNFRVAGK